MTNGKKRLRRRPGRAPSKALLSTLLPDVGVRDVLAVSKVVFALSLPDNEIGDVGSESFAGVLVQCPTLTHLYL